ncbi:PREDICTED: uncharacterized protein LOC109152024 [Ipomoea nil]|uniref:uncharacterized protein LOC109152024 n=1 Tax=Ipomoea nil TaxID=35883 RepID=UPI000900F77D|nr:PREDICTED: uncharacterized protein LOC109152024 [Ipomoea nil]
MKKGIPFIWDEACKNAFESIKSYLMKPPVLTAPVHGRPLILYISAQDCSVGALLAQENDKGKENALYYLSRMMTLNELKYSPIEKLCLALVFAIKKLKHYFEAHTIRLVSKANPVKYVMAKVVLSDRLARWYLLFQQFEIIYVPQKSVKGQALADFLADHPIPAEWELSDDLPDEDVLVIEVLPPWKMYFDGASHREGAGAGVVFVTPEGEVLPYSFTLTEQCSNNVAEYQALILGLEIAADMKQLRINIYGDSKLIINQVLGLYEVKKAELVPYNNYAKILMQWLGDVTIEHVPRKENKQADALAALASTIAHPAARIQVCQRWVVPPIFNEDGSVDETVELPTASVYDIGKDDWRQPLIDYLTDGKLPEDPRKRVDIKRRTPRFIYYKETLYRRSFDGIFLRCLGEEEALQAMQEAHSGVCGAHQSGPKLHFHIKRMGYYWPTMVKDCIDYARRCQACQYHANFIHQPPEPLHPTVASWPFDAWGLDVVGPITPKSSAGHAYILAATDYFSKWAEAVALKEVKKENVADFLRVHIVYRFGIPRYILTDNGKPFDNKLMDKICKLFDFKQRNSSAYYAAANGLAEAFNKTLCNLLKKVVSKSKRDWHDRMEEALWAYRTTYRTPTQSTPYSLVYGVEAVLPLERQIPSLRLAIQEGLTDEENAKLRLAELEALDEKRLQAQESLECYQARMSRAFNKRVRTRSFQIGDKVLAVRRPIIVTRKTGHKFTSRWDGPYVILEVYTSGAYKLISEDGLKIGPINGRTQDGTTETSCKDFRNAYQRTASLKPASADSGYSNAEQRPPQQQSPTVWEPGRSTPSVGSLSPSLRRGRGSYSVKRVDPNVRQDLQDSARLNSEARKALTVSKPKILNKAYLCAANLYRVQQVQKGIRDNRKMSFERSDAPVVRSLIVTGTESARSFQRNDLNGGKTPQPTRSNKTKGRHYVCKKCGSDHPGLDCHRKPAVCFACGKKGHRSFECMVKEKTSSKSNPTGSVRSQPGNKFRI